MSIRTCATARQCFSGLQGTGKPPDTCQERTWPSTGGTSKETLCRPPLPNSSASWPYLRKEKKNPSCWKRETAGCLESIRSERLDTYRVTGRKDGHTLTLRHRDGRLFKDVTLPSPLPGTDEGQYLAVQLVTYLGKTRASGPVRWLGKESVDAWNGEALWDAIDKEEREDAKRTYFTTFFGKRLSLYDDLYTLPQDPEEARYASQGIYLDEPNILDFLQWLKPEETAPL